MLLNNLPNAGLREFENYVCSLSRDSVCGWLVNSKHPIFLSDQHGANGKQLALKFELVRISQKENKMCAANLQTVAW